MARFLAVILGLSTFGVVQGTPAQCDAVDKQCNEYVKGRMCDMENDPADKWKYNATHMNVAVFKGLTGWQEFYQQDADMAVLCAIDHAQAQGVLSDLVVEPVWVDDESSDSGGVKAGLCMVHGGLEYAVGPFGSSIALNAGIIGKLFEINMLGTATSSPLLSNKGEAQGFPFFSRVFPSDVFQSKLIAEMAHQMGISKVATISLSPQAYYDGIVNGFHSFAHDLGMTTMSVTMPIDADKETVSELLQTIKTNGFRVVFIATEYYNLTMTTADELGMVGDGWVWFGTEELVAEYSLITPHLLQGMFALVPALNASAQPLQDFHNCIDEHRNDITGKYANMHLNEDPKEMWFAFYYDAMHIMLRAIQTTRDDNQLGNATYFRSSLRSLSFNGASGTIEFDDKGDRIGAVYNVINFHYDKDSVSVNRTEIGIIDTKTMDINLDTSLMQFHDKRNVAPPDFDIGVCTVENHFNVSTSECVGGERTVVYNPRTDDAKRYCEAIPTLTVGCDYPSGVQTGTIVAIVGLVVNVILTALVFVYFKHPIIIRSQRRMVVVMCFGAIIAQLEPLFTGGEPTDGICIAVPIIISTSYLLLFGPLFLKSYRVSVILNNRKLKVIKISDKMLFKRLGALILINTVILVIMIVDDPPRSLLTNKQVSQEDGTWPTTILDRRCASAGGTYSTLLIFFLGMLMLAGCYISFTIRNARADLSEAKWIFISIYNGAVWALITCFLVFRVEGVDAAGIYDFVAVGVTITSTATLVLVLVPKFLMIKSGVRVDDLTKTTAATVVSRAATSEASSCVES